ncbi:uncharacterized protein LOC106883920 isoform X2 [Octopus bimaculoides]|uniref:DH domain-containing protein n=1 Tax=Octopus bimaculoides TaxID=37653 RepID=A0A0L8I5S6_OCTBM|nr:uncharacterized protein LOC106883920 isoform X2 [Octopus bimaculoides]|eukprot:XP_014790545.1 PREDICTED: uncharacterized protein LOC106883920 isoform X2 [Octopus bimaculoides]
MNSIIDNFHDINIDKNVIKNYSTVESKITESREDEYGVQEISISAEPSQVSIRNGRPPSVETDSWGILEEIMSSSSIAVEPKMTYQEKVECMTSLRKIILEKILMNGNVDLAEMRRLLSCRDIFEENVVLSSLDLLKVDNMFSLIPKLIKSMEYFLAELNAALKNWSENSSLSGAYSNIMSNVALFYEYNSTIAIVLNILQGNEGIESYDATMKKVMPNIETPFSDLLHCPIIAHYRVYFGLKRLHLIKSGYAVQMDKNKRKLRFLFLFPKNLIITKLKIKSNCAYFHTKGIIRLGKRMVTIESTVI